jgi:hypothetical protein
VAADRPHCRWCAAAAAGVCPAKHAQAVAGLGLEGQVTTVDQVTVPMLPDPKTFDAEKLGRILAVKDAITSWLGQVEDYAFGLMQSGAAVPGFKLVEKLSRRKWTGAEADVAAYLTLVHGLDEDEVRPRKLVTITEAEKLLKAALPEPAALKAAKDELSLLYTLKDTSGLTIAPTSDKRDAVDAVANAIAGLPAGLAA